MAQFPKYDLPSNISMETAWRHNKERYS